MPRKPPADGTPPPGKAKRHNAPRCLVVAVPVELVPLAAGSGAAQRVSCRSVWVLASRRNGTAWTAPAAPSELPADELWPHIARLCKKGRRVVVVAPVGSHLLTLAGFWDAEESGLFRVRQYLPTKGKTRGQPADRKPWLGKLVLAGTPTIVTARCRSGGSLKVLSASNYCELSARELARVGGVPLRHHEADSPNGTDIGLDPDNHCLALSRWLRATISGWVERHRCPWADTAAGLSVQLWRSLDGPHAVKRHPVEPALELEREACHGGRASVWFYGPVGDRSACPAPPADPPPDGPYPALPGPAVHLDVASMYPWLLGHHLFPVRLLSVRQDVPLDQAKAICQYEGCIARVTLDASEPEYPVRLPGRTAYPVGPCQTTLAGPELLAAFAAGDVRRVHLLARYRLGRPFRHWSRRVLAERLRHRSLGDAAGEALWKGIANTFGGKFAQTNYRWTPCPRETAPVAWGEYLVSDVASGLCERRRCISGIVHRKTDCSQSPRFPRSVYAYLTALGRTHIRSVRRRIGPQHCLSQDTDGLWVLPAGLDAARAAGLIDRPGPGSLRVTGTAEYIRWWDARHYYRDGRWTCAGVAAGWQLTGTGVVEERRKVDPARTGGDPSERTLLSVVRSIRLEGVPPAGRVGPDGWALPTPLDGWAGPARLRDGDRGERETKYRV